MNKFRNTILILLGIIITTVLVFDKLDINIDDKGRLFDDATFIVAEGTSYSFFSKVGEDNDLDFDKFSGTYLLASFEGAASVEINLETDIDKGRFKVVLIDPYNNITELDNTTLKIDTSQGQYRIKMVGDNAYGQIQLSIKLTDIEGTVE